MDINKISGFGKTPEKINSPDDVKKMYNDINHKSTIYDDAVLIKKLLDDRRELLEALIRAYQDMDEAGWHVIPDDIIKKITGLTWEELQG